MSDSMSWCYDRIEELEDELKDNLPAHKHNKIVRELRTFGVYRYSLKEEGKDEER